MPVPFISFFAAKFIYFINLQLLYFDSKIIIESIYLVIC